MSESKTIFKVGIAGFGIVGKRRKYYIDQHPSLVVTSVCDVYYEKNSPGDDTINYYTNYKELLKNEVLDILFVCLPNYLAAEVTMVGLNRGLHVFCEKPPGRSVKDIQDVIEVEKNHPKLKLKYGFNHRYHHSIKKALAVIKSGELGEVINLRGIYGKSKVVTFSGGWRAERKHSGGGILLDQGIHMIDLMRLFCGDFEDVKSFISNDYWNFDVEDNAYAIMRDAKGRVAMLHSSATQWQHRFKLDISTTEGYLELHGILSGSKSYGEERIVIGKRNKVSFGDRSKNGIMETNNIRYLEDNSWRDEIHEFADAIIHQKSIIYGTSKDALNTMKLVYKIYFADNSWTDKFNISP